MPIIICDKLRSGKMSYDFNEGERTIRLEEDIPETGEQGAWFDHKTEVSFDDINAILQENSSVETRDFASLFDQHTANNGPMLVAALINEGILVKGTQGQFYVEDKYL